MSMFPTGAGAKRHSHRTDRLIHFQTIFQCHHSLLTPPTFCSRGSAYKKKVITKQCRMWVSNVDVWTKSSSHFYLLRIGENRNICQYSSSWSAAVFSIDLWEPIKAGETWSWSQTETRSNVPPGGGLMKLWQISPEKMNRKPPKLNFKYDFCIRPKSGYSSLSSMGRNTN